MHIQSYKAVVQKPVREKHLCDIYGKLVASKLKALDKRTQ